MNKEFDCVEFKRQLQANAWKRSGAKNLNEYVTWSKKIAEQSPLHRKYEEFPVNTKEISTKR